MGQGLASGIVLAVILIIPIGIFFSLPPGPEKVEELNWVEEATVVSSKVVTRNSSKVCSFTVSKEHKEKAEEVTFFVNERMCSKFDEAGVEQVDVGFNGQLEVERLVFYIMGEKVEYE